MNNNSLSTASNTFTGNHEPGLIFSIIGVYLVFTSLEDLDLVPNGIAFFVLIMAIPLSILIQDHYRKRMKPPEVDPELKKYDKWLAWLSFGVLICCFVLDLLLKLPISLVFIAILIFLLFNFVETKTINIYKITAFLFLLLLIVSGFLANTTEITLGNTQVWFVIFGILMILLGIISHFKIIKKFPNSSAAANDQNPPNFTEEMPYSD